jgi:hypothetical protein
MLRRVPTFAFCALMSAALGAGLAEVVVAASVLVGLAAGGLAWLDARREASNSAV